MRWVSVSLPVVVLVSFFGMAVADDEGEPGQTEPPAVSQVADRVLNAVRAEDRDGFERIARDGVHDPWLVADELCARGEHDAADEFARAVPGKATERLPAYVASRRGVESDGAVRAAVTAASAEVRRGGPQAPSAVLAALEGLSKPEGTVSEVRMDFLRGWALEWQRHSADSAVAYVEAGEAALKLGWHVRARQSFMRAGSQALLVSDWRRADTAWGKALQEAEVLGNAAGVADALRGIGITRQRLGDFGLALAHHERALRSYEALGRLGDVAGVEVNVGITYSALGRYAKALEVWEQAFRHAEQAGEGAPAASALHNIAGLYWRAGDSSTARAYAERALRRHASVGNYRGMVAIAIGLGMVHTQAGEHELARTSLERALALAQAIESKYYSAIALAGLGDVYEALGDRGEAMASYAKALVLQEEIGSRVSSAILTGQMGLLAIRSGRREEGIRQVKEAIRATRRLRARPPLVENLSGLAEVYFDAGEPMQALYLAREALGELEYLLGGLGGDEAAGVRSRHAGLFAVGARAAAALDEPADVATFLESGRAGSLLEILGGRDALRWTSLSPELRDVEREAKERHTRAHAAYQTAVVGGKRADIRAKTKLLEEAALGMRDVVARIRREAKGQAAGLFYPRAATVEELRESLDAGQALVLYGLCGDDALALVLTPDRESIVSLGSASGVVAACEALDASDPDVDPEAALARLRKALVDPLDLPADVTEVVVSPAGPLGYLPLGALFDRAVAFAPSGTTHVLLHREAKPPGEGVLALGDPDYAGVSEGAHALYVRGRALTPLPATREEAETVGDEVLLGAEASKEGLRAALGERRRWRALHLACHGLVDPENPRLSSLALSSSEEEDGFLTALEVLGMDVSADLAVLSACETAKGKIVTGEGIIGLTRAFMFAGAPRVLCSLWRVDDDATRALMIKFYELWHPEGGQNAAKPLGAAAALREAQAYVRSQEQWKHPRFWAAWVLWGLPR